MTVHPQVAALLEAAARSPLPTLDKVSAFVARRLYAERCKTVAPKNAPAVAARILLADGVAVRAYRPSKDELLPALIYFHGGGWTIGDLDTHDTLCRELAKGANCAVFSVEYRLAPESPFPAAVEDCVRASQWIQREAAALHIDPGRIAVGGDSAGGNLAAVVALHMPHGLCFQLLIYPATDQRFKTGSLTRNGEGYLLTLALMERFRANYLPDPAAYNDWRASPALAKSFKGLPPTFILTAGFDPLLDEGREYAELLARDGVEVAYRNYADMIHGFILMGGVLDTASTAVADCCAALRRAFDKVPA